MTITKEQIEQAKHDLFYEDGTFRFKDIHEHTQTIDFALRLAHKVMSEPSEGMNNQHDRLERACDVLDDLGDSDATLLELRRLRQKNEDAKQDALEDLDMLFDSTTKSYLDKEKYQTIRDYIKSVDAKADSQADIESKNKLRKQRDAASERALIYAAKLGEAEMKIHELKIRLEMEGIEG